ncbi:MAG: ferredoxin [Desulfobacteraceae bacterium]|nr:ferredoxin [Desulfobacteraceae bacterium]MBC2756426.1 ferredoxin [Desulfobacteraceae bacterium]MBC2763556.1 ferredoxin [ANME-2 cluster archaeon]
MSDQIEGFAENVPGKYYITKSCIGCALCAVIAPENFMENTDEELAVGHNYIYKQPETESEELLCKEAMDVCPADAIRNNGSSN